MTSLAIINTTIKAASRGTIERTASNPSSIRSICEEFRALRQAEKDLMIRNREGRRTINALMPQPDASIVHGAATAADGISEDRWVDEAPHNAVRPHLIEEAIAKIKPKEMTISRPAPNVTIMVEHDPLPLPDAQLATRSSLLARLELSRAYFAEQTRQMEAAGLGWKSENATEAWADRLFRLEQKICKLKARTADELLAKVETFQSDPDFFDPANTGGGLIKSIMDDTAALCKTSWGRQ